MSEDMSDDIQLTTNFRLSEFYCPCCGKAKISTALPRLLQQIRDEVGEPLTISSGYRCAKHNAEVGGVPNSDHTKGLAVDIPISESALRYRLVRAIMLADTPYVRIYPGHVHISCVPAKIHRFDIQEAKCRL